MKITKNLKFSLHLVVMVAMVIYLSVGSIMPANAIESILIDPTIITEGPIDPQMSITKTVDTNTATPDDLVSYTIEATNDSTAQNTPLDVMLVIDRSGSMDNDGNGCTDITYDNKADCESNGGVWGKQPITNAIESAKSFVDQLNSSIDRSGAVSFSSSSHIDLLHGLTYNQNDVKNSIDGLYAHGGTRINLGIDKAYNELSTYGRSTPTKQIMIVLSDGVSGGDPEASALVAKNAGIRVITIGLGDGVNEAEMKAIASSESDYYFAPSGSDLNSVYTSILGTLCDKKTLTITDDITDVLVDADLVSTNPTATQVGNALSWTFPNVGCGETVSATVTVKVSSSKASDGSVMDNDATVTDERENTVPAEPVHTAITIPTPQPETFIDLTIKKDVDATEANPGDTLNYTLLVTNTGTAPATNVTVDDALPVGLTYQDGTTTKQWVFDNIPVGSNETITYVAIISPDVENINLKNTAKVSSEGDFFGEDVAQTSVANKVTTPIVLGEEALPALSVNKTANVEFANLGDTITYTIVVTNTGDAMAVDTVLIDHIAAGMQFSDTVAPTHTWMLGDIAPGNSVTTTYDVVILKDNEPGIYRNTAEVWAQGVANVFDTADVEVRKIQVLGAETLPTTGGSLMPFIYLLGAGLVITFSGFLLKLTFNKK